jgi:nucleotide-binding universal stress UspA family protein
MFKENQMVTANPSTETHPTPALEEHSADPLVQSIVLATDGGTAGEGATRWIVQRGRMHRLNVLVLTVADVERFSAQLSKTVLDEQRAAAEHTARAIRRKVPSAEVAWRVDTGDARQKLAAASAGYDMIVVGSNRTGRLAGMLGASFSMKLVEAAACPAIVVPKAWRPGHGAVVLGIQGDRHDEAPLRFAVHEARVLHRPLRVVHAWDVPAMVKTGPLREEALGEQSSVMHAALKKLRAGNPDLDIEGVLAEEHPSLALTRSAAGAELLVVGTHGRSAGDRFFVGSVSREILSRPPCPVAVVRP